MSNFNRIKFIIVTTIILVFAACKKETTAPDPIADFYAEVKNCQNDTCVVYFYDNSINSLSRKWDFGNGFNSILLLDSTNYLFGESYTITLKVLNSEGVEDSKIKTIQL